MKRQFYVFFIRWMLNSFGLWLTIVIFGTGISDEQLTAGFLGFLLAGLIFSIVNAVLRPVVIILSLPAILITLGLFTFVVNGFLVWLSLKLAPGIQMTFLYSILTGMILSLINYVVSSVFELQTEYAYKKKEMRG